MFRIRMMFPPDPNYPTRIFYMYITIHTHRYIYIYLIHTYVYSLKCVSYGHICTTCTNRRWTNLNTLTTDPTHPMHRMHSLVVGASRGLGLALTRHLAEVAHRAGGSGVSQGRVLAAARRPVPALEEVRRRQQLFGEWCAV